MCTAREGNPRGPHAVRGTHREALTKAAVAGEGPSSRAAAAATAPPTARRSWAPAARAGPAAARPRCALPRAAAGRRNADTQRRL